MIRNLKAATRFLSVSILMGSLIASVPDVSRAQSETPVPERNVHEEQSDQAPSRPGIVTIKTSSTESLASVEKQLKQNETNRIVSAVSKYLAAAKKDYSPRYGARTGAAREQLVSQLRDYVKYSETAGHEDAKALVESLQIPALIRYSEEAPTIFRGRLASVRDALADYARSSKQNVERERSLAVLMDYYLAVFEAADLGTLEAPVATGDQEEETTESSDEELEREKQACFEFYCDALDEGVRAYFYGEEGGSIDKIVRAIGEMRYYQSESPAVSRLTGYLHDVFSGSNFYLEASEKFLSAFTYRNVSESFGVNENIRGTQAQGAGSLNGHTVLDVKPSPTRAQMALVLNANVLTRTVGANRGVFVHTDNLGSVVASKPMFLNPDGRISTSAALANANMKTTLRGVNTDRITLFGGKIIQNKVSQELPASERDGAERIKARVARELDEQANAQILEMNRRIEHMDIGSANSMIQNLKSRTSEDRFYIECVLGRGLQFSAPGDDAASCNDVSRGASSSDEIVERGAAKTAEPGLLRGVRGSALTTLAPNLRNSAIISASSNSILPRLDSLRPFRPVSTEKKSVSEPDLVVRFHESAPNNAATIALAGALFGPGYDTLDNVILRFPGVDPEDVKKLLVPYEPQGVRELDPDDHAQKVFVRFDEVQPFSTRFENDTITTVLRVSSCDVDGKEWGPIEVRMVYRLEIRDDRFVFVRDELEVLPGGYQDGDPVSARFYTFRRIFIKRLETTINEEYVFSPLPVDTIAALENRGSLKPKKVEARDGWLRVEFDLDPIHEEANAARSAESEASSNQG